MPTLYRYRNWRIAMHFDDHGLPHFHIICNGEEVVVLIDTLQVLEGDVDKRALIEGLDWAGDILSLLHKSWVYFNCGLPACCP
jgi:hypothetical protein